MLTAAQTTRLRCSPDTSNKPSEMTPAKATATRPATRETALFTADATPARALSTAASTAAVKGATVMVKPSPNTTAPGNTWVQ